MRNVELNELNLKKWLQWRNVLSIIFKRIENWDKGKWNI